MTEASIETNFVVVLGLKAPVLDNSTPLLEYVPYIHYLLCFRKDQYKIKVLINSSSKINAITLAYTKRLGFWTQKINVGAQKLNSSSLTTYEIVIAKFQIKNK